MKIFAKINDDFYEVNYNNDAVLPAGFVEMKEERPDIKYIASEKGEWIKQPDNNESFNMV
ncbi:hypothetical protein RHO14_11575 [Orbus wheelerorum]|uniref:hypothetical protein n=1 Tax=Orbus wheelerorum TaxID=3074111 RepID=UPI00370D0300